MGVGNRAFRNVWRKWPRTLVVVIALGLSIATIISMNIGIEASKKNTLDMIQSYEDRLNEMENLNEQQATMITVTNMTWPGGFNRTGGFPGGGGGDRPPGGDIPGGGDRPQGGDIPGGYTGGFVRNTGPVTANAVTSISALKNVSVVIPMVQHSFGQNFRRADYAVRGVPLDPTLLSKYNLLPSNLVDGYLITSTDTSKILISTQLQSHFNNATVGSHITINGTDFNVAGIYSSDTENNLVYMSLADAQKVSGYDSKTVSTIEVYATNESTVDGVVYDIQQLYPTYMTVAYSEMAARQLDFFKTRQGQEIASLESDQNKTQSTGDQIMVISGATAGLIVFFLMTYTVRERIKEIGTLRALGFSKSNVMAQFVAEGMIVGLIGGLLGIVIALEATPNIMRAFLPSAQAYANTTPSLEMVLISLGLTIFLGAVGSIYPAFSAAHKKPAEAMKNE